MRQWGTYYGGIEDDKGHSVSADNNGNVYLVGNTKSASNISSSGLVYQDTLGGNRDAFLVKFDSNGVRQWGTYYGGEGFEDAYSVCTDQSNYVYFAGRTSSHKNIGFNGFLNSKPHKAGYDAFLIKFDSNGVRQWGTYYGGKGTDVANSACVDNFGNIYVAGYTLSFSGIAHNGHQSSLGGFYDIFLVKFNNNGARQWGTYYGGSGGDLCFSAATDRSGNVFLTGWTNSIHSFSHKGFQNVHNGAISDAFIIKFSGNGSREWATYYGGEGADVGLAINTDSSENLYVTGYTQSYNHIAYGSRNNVLLGGESAFLLKLTSKGNKIWSQYLKASGLENGNGLSVDLSNNVYMAGTAKGGGTVLGINGHSDTAKSYQSAFLTKFSTEKILLNELSPSIFCSGDSLSIKFTKKLNTGTGNKYFFQLSDTLGYFKNDTSNILFSILDSTKGLDSFSIASLAHLSSSKKYRLRLFSTFFSDTAYYQDSIIVHPNPNTLFTTNGSQCGLSDSITFLKSVLGDTTIASFQWNFGDSSVSNSLSPSKTYSKLGVFNAQLAATNIFGCSSSYTRQVFVNDIPIVAFDANKASQCLKNNKFIFTNKSTIVNDSLSFKWSFGDLSIDSVMSPQKSYNGIGVFDVKLVATSKNNCIDSLSKAVVVNVHPYVNIKTLSNDECQGKTARFEASIKDSTNSYFWVVGGVHNTKDTLVNYTTTQQETIYLVQKNKEGCYDTSTVVNSVFKPLPVKPVLFQTNKELDAGSGYATYQWYRNGNELNGGTSQKYNIAQNGNYHCKVTNNDSCENWSDTISILNLNISPIPKDNSFRVYPNPNKGEFVADFRNNIGYKRLYLIDISGRILFQLSTNKHSVKLDFNHLSEGIYFLEIDNGDIVQSQKVILTK